MPPFHKHVPEHEPTGTDITGYINFYGVVILSDSDVLL